ncbi:hypothetical protein KEM54_006299 [Ascosphaera aggregata]|nr:hypothetical protein KEM54_006299 [Ascosphaera aggregata]
MSWVSGAAAGEWEEPTPTISGWNGGGDGAGATGGYDAQWAAGGGNEFGSDVGGDPTREPSDDKCRKHNKAECTKPRVFRGTCRICEKEGHPASECPDRPPDICKNCRQEGHKTLECTANRVFDLTTIPDKMPEEAWEMMRKASAEREMDEFRDAFKIYSKAVPTETLPEIERKMRDAKFKVYLIALEKLESDVHVLVNLQGRLGCKYVVGFYFSDKPHRANLKDRWPESAEANLKRLEDAGFPMDRRVPKCGNCNASDWNLAELGHIAKHCKQEKTAIERVEINKPGHNAKECPEPRSAATVECRICNQMGHFAKDCPEKPDREGAGGVDRACRNCGQEGHMARDCDQPRNMSTVTCRNCEQMGHFSRDCTEPKNWSKVKCNTCGEMGHTSTRCRQVAADDNGDSNGFNDIPGPPPVDDGFGRVSVATGNGGFGGWGGDAAGGGGGGGDDGGQLAEMTAW